MMQYLQVHLQPEISYTVSPCARFMHCPQRSHEVALEQIGLCLKGTGKEGLIWCPCKNTKMQVDVFVDADFAGLWPHEDKPDPTCIKSQTGFVMCITNCPVIWQSKLQSEIATLTTKTEYMVLSMAMRSVIPFFNVARAIKAHLGLDNSQSTFKVNVWEDNSACHTLANLKPGQTSPRTKHCAIKLHWFHSYLELNNIKIEKMSMDLQQADIFTKGLQNSKFPKIRKLLCGW